MPKITFVNEFKTVEVDEKTDVRKAAIQAGINLYQGLYKYVNCRGHGMCGSCKVEVAEGEATPASLGIRESLEINALVEPTMRLACQIRAKTDLKIVSQNPPRWDLRGRAPEEVERIQAMDA